jgi:DnaJ-class molecular chaperone
VSSGKTYKICETCRGSGTITVYSPGGESEESCFNCNGDGQVEFGFTEDSNKVDKIYNDVKSILKILEKE